MSRRPSHPTRAAPAGTAAAASQRRDPAPFDQAACVARLAACGNVEDLLEGLRGGLAVTPQEAHFWLEARFEVIDQRRRQPNESADAAAAERLKEMTFDGVIDLPSFKSRAAAVSVAVTPRFADPLVLPLPYLLSAGQMVDLYAEKWWLWDGLRKDFARRILPGLTEPQKEEYRRLLRPQLDPSLWPQSYGDFPPASFFVARDLGMTDELRPVVLGWADGSYRGWGESQHYPDLVFGFAGDPEFVRTQMARLGIGMYSADRMREWLAATGAAGLALARDTVLKATSKHAAAQLARVLAGVRARENAPHMLEVMLRSKAPKPAKDWLDDHPELAIPGLVPLAADKGKLADAAVAYLRDARAKGHEQAIREALPSAPAVAADRVRREVLGAGAGGGAEVIDADALPPDLRAALDAARSRFGRRGVASAHLPPVLVGGRRLGDGDVAALLDVLRAGPLEPRPPLVAALRRHADGGALDAFAWRVFEDWVTSGAPPKQVWAMGALGHLGSDAAALGLAPLLRQWKGDGRRVRTKMGFQCLRTIGSPTALSGLSAIARTAPGRATRILAEQVFAAAARDRGLTPGRLEDRIVPDCGLGENENRGRVFDLGPRRFRLVLTTALRAGVRDEGEDGQNGGRVRRDLPTPSARDDPAKAAAAVADWKRVRRQVDETIAGQTWRLEQAMTTARRWAADEFEALLVPHPLAGHLVRLLVWSGYDAAGRLAATFRVADDGTYADVRDRAVPFGRHGLVRVGVAHPVEMSDGEPGAWGDLLGEYHLIQPFDQLRRPVYRLDDAERRDTEVRRLTTIEFPGGRLGKALDRDGWVREPGDGSTPGEFAGHRKPMPDAGLSTVITYDPAFLAAVRSGSPPQRVAACYFARTAPDGKIPPPEARERVPLSDVPPVIVSEVIAYVNRLATEKGAKK